MAKILQKLLFSWLSRLGPWGSCTSSISIVFLPLNETPIYVQRKLIFFLSTLLPSSFMTTTWGCPYMYIQYIVYMHHICSKEPIFFIPPCCFLHLWQTYEVARTRFYFIANDIGTMSTVQSRRRVVIHSLIHSRYEYLYI